MSMRRQDITFVITIVAIVLAVRALVQGDYIWLLAWSLVGGVSALAGQYWSRRYPGPMSYALFWILYFPRPFHSSRRLQQILDPRPGERVLEIGPGIGLNALPIANALGPDGVLDVLDVQEKMIIHLERRAARAGVTNIVATQADAKQLPYADDSFDGVYLVTTLGEISDKDAALREIHRILKPSGRVIIGEFFLDPDFQTLGETRERLQRAEFTFKRKTGLAWSYLARFEPE